MLEAKRASERLTPRSFTREGAARGVRVIDRQADVKDVAADLGVTPETLWTWVRDAENGGSEPGSRPGPESVHAEPSRLRAESAHSRDSSAAAPEATRGPAGTRAPNATRSSPPQARALQAPEGRGAAPAASPRGVPRP
ncbi:transposase [Kitasatospora arboriphila]